MIKAVIFDMDGIIIDSEPIQSKSYELVLQKYGITPEYNADGLIQVLGVHSEGNWKLLKNKHKISESVYKLKEKKQEVYLELIKNNLSPMPGLINLLKFFKKKSLPLAIASSSTPKQISIIVDLLKISDYFDVMISGEEVKRGKPHPDVFLEAAKKLGVKPETCLVLEDAETGVLAGKAAGMKVIAVKNKYTTTQDHSKADKIVHSLEEINEELINSL